MRELPWNVFRELESLTQRMQSLLEAAFLAPVNPPSPAAAFPPVDVYEVGDAVVVEAELPGVAADQLHVELVGTKLVLSGKMDPEDPATGETVLRMERPRGRFHRTVPLPAPVAPPFDASLRQGVLTVRLPKAGGSGRSIPISREGA
ncbi:MAG: Hsp20/alpha crystallin family protein [Thermoanaerobaculum sp.]